VPANGNGVRLTDGTLDFSGGVNSARVPTISGPLVPQGLARNQVAWGINCQMRQGGIAQREGWSPLVQDAPWSGLYQGGILMERQFGDPYLLLAIGGSLWRVRVDTDNTVDNLSTVFGGALTMPPTEPLAHFTQGELFVVWQAGDLTTNPIFFWDDGDALIGMRRSLGFVGVNNAANEIPPAGPMDYYQNRIWYAFGNAYAAGDIVTNQTSGTAVFDYRDAILHVTENPVAKGGDAFRLPVTAGNIRALKHATNLDTATGTSDLYVFTRRGVFTCNAPITRADWTTTTLNEMPLQKVALIKGGAYSDRAVTAVNADLFFCAPPNGDVRTIQTAVRYFHQWGQLPVSRNENRILAFNDRSMLRFTSSIEFNNRFLQTCSPVAVPAGTAFRTLLPLDFDVLSSFEERTPPIWQGSYEALPVLQLFEGDFGGRPRAFAVIWSDLHQAIEVWEISDSLLFDNGDTRIAFQLETPAYTFGNPFQLKELETLELWCDRLIGTAQFEVSYRPDSWPCWLPWHIWTECSAKDCAEEMPTVSCPSYPTEFNCPSFKATMTLPKPAAQCIMPSGRPSNQGYQFQLKILIRGAVRIRGLVVYSLPLSKAPFAGLVC
jgi:hypothetical protein